jgi:hypothetical protein
MSIKSAVVTVLALAFSVPQLAMAPAAAVDDTTAPRGWAEVFIADAENAPPPYPEPGWDEGPRNYTLDLEYPQPGSPNVVKSQVPWTNEPYFLIVVHCEDEPGGSGCDPNWYRDHTAEGDGILFVPWGKWMGNTTNATHSYSLSVRDLAGNQFSFGAIFQTDYSSPELWPAVSPNPVVQGEAAVATPNATDATNTVPEGIGQTLKIDGVPVNGYSQLNASETYCNPVDTSVVGTFEVQCQATDNAGNATYNTAIYTVEPPVDTTPPVVTWVFPEPPASGWYTQYPTAVVTATDPSGIESISCQPGDYVKQVDGLGTATATTSVTFAQSASAPGAPFDCYAMDGAGNHGAAPGSSEVTRLKVDVDAPTLTLVVPDAGQYSAQPTNGWYNLAPVLGYVNASSISPLMEISCDGADLVSDITPGASYLGTRALEVRAEGVSDVTCSATNEAGLTGAADGSTNTATVKVDTSPPVVTWSFPEVPTSGWYAEQPVATVTATDMAGIDYIACAPGYSEVDAGGQTTFTTNVTLDQIAGVNVPFDCYGVDTAGNPAGKGPGSSDVTTISFETVPPVVDVVFPEAPASGWFDTSPVVGSVNYRANSTVTAVSCTGAAVSDASGIGAQNGTAMLTVTAEGASEVVCTATNGAGLTGAAAGSTNTATVRIATAEPFLTVTGVADGAVYPLGGVPQGGCAAAGGATLATQPTYSVTGGTTNGFGTYSATCSGAVDVLGRASQPVSVTYTVTYAFLGFARPLPDQTFPKRRTSNFIAAFQMGTYMGTRIGTGSVTKAVLSTAPNGVGPLTEGTCRYTRTTNRWECRINMPTSVQTDGRAYYVTALQQIGTSWHVMPNGEAVTNPNSQIVRFSP